MQNSISSLTVKSDHNQNFENTDQLRKRFAEQLTRSIKKAYSGKKPSYAVIARDYSLRSRNGPVSSETIRKWMLGIAIPQASRLQTLIGWLGTELADVLHIFSEQPNVYQKETRNPNSQIGETSHQYFFKNGSEDYMDRHILHLIKNLSTRDRNMVLTMLEVLKQSSDHSNE